MHSDEFSKVSDVLGNWRYPLEINETMNIIIRWKYKLDHEWKYAIFKKLGYIIQYRQPSTFEHNWFMKVCANVEFFKVEACK